jgi:putative ABC transport system permease protein
MLNTFWQDVRFGLRMLAKSPGFAAIAVVTLALGIGANTALFSIVNGVLLNPLPYQQPDRLVALYAKTGDFSRASISYPNFLDWQRDNTSFSQLAAFRPDNFSLTGMGEPERIKVQMVSSSFFPLLGIKPVLGRVFSKQEDQVGAAPVALISGGFWNRKLGSSPDAIGKAITLNGTAYTIVGVIPGDFRYYSGNYHQSEVFVPIGQWNDSTFRDRRVAMGMDAVGRLKPGVTLAQAKADMDSAAANLSTVYPDADKNSGITLIPLKQDIVGDIRPFLLVLLAAVGFVLLIACANVANLLLARSTGRTREFAIRSALGAGTGRVVRQLLTESVLLAMTGGAIGLMIAIWGTQAALKALPEALPRAQAIHVDGRVLLFTLAASFLAGILFGLAPALKISRGDIHETLKEGGRGGSGARHRTQSIFVATEMGLAVVLLISAGLMIRSLGKLWSVDPGFDPHNVITFSIASAAPLAPTPDGIRAVYRRLHDAMSSVPGVQAVSLSVGSTPMSGDSELPFWLEGQPKPSSESDMKFSLFYLVQPDYLGSMKIPLLRGRFLTKQDSEHSPLVAVIDTQFAKLYFGNEDPIGKHINFDILGKTVEIVGVVGHIKQWGLDTDAQSKVQAQSYLPLSQLPDQFMPLVARGVGVVARTEASPAGEMDALRHAVDGVNSQLVVYGTESMEDIISDSLAARRFAMMLLGIFAALAVVLSSVGIYGVISYVVGQRTHEIGIRMALGARPGSVQRMVLGQGTKMTLFGVSIGLASALLLTRLMAKMLFGVSSHDPLTFLGVALLLIFVALAACYIPARRATRVDPMVALRYE